MADTSRARDALALVLALGALALAACSGPEPIMGTVLEAAHPAPSFQLRDQLNRQVSLSDFEADVVLLSFLYTYCPDVCPAATANLKKAHELLGSDAALVDFVAISVDPERDTVERAHEYSESWGMLDKWSFLVGPEETLRPIWKGYYIDPSETEWDRDEAPPVSSGAGPSRSGLDALRREIATRYEVVHSTPVYLLDRERRMRVLFTPPLDPDAIVHDIRLLLE